MHVKEVMYSKKCYKTVFISAYELNMMYCDCNFVNQVSLHTLNQYKSVIFISIMTYFKKKYLYHLLGLQTVLTYTSARAFHWLKVKIYISPLKGQ